MSVTPVLSEPATVGIQPAGQARQAALAELRRASEQLVGMTFFQTLLQTADSTALKGKYGHGGRGEEVFRQQMNAVFAERAAASSRFPLVDAIYDQMARRYLKSTGADDGGASPTFGRPAWSNPE